MYGIYGNMDPINIPPMLALIYQHHGSYGILYIVYFVITVYPNHPIVQCREAEKPKVSTRGEKRRRYWESLSGTWGNQLGLPTVHPRNRTWVIIPVTRRASRDNPAVIGVMGMVCGWSFTTYIHRYWRFQQQKLLAIPRLTHQPRDMNEYRRDPHERNHSQGWRAVHGGDLGFRPPYPQEINNDKYVAAAVPQRHFSEQSCLVWPGPGFRQVMWNG